MILILTALCLPLWRSPRYTMILCLGVNIERWMDYTNQNREEIKGLLREVFPKNMLVYVILLSGLR